MRLSFVLWLLLGTSLYGQVNNQPSKVKTITIERPVFLDTKPQFNPSFSCWFPNWLPLNDVIPVKVLSATSTSSEWVSLIFDEGYKRAIAKLDAVFLSVTYKDSETGTELSPREVLVISESFTYPSSLVCQTHSNLEQKTVGFEFETYGLVIGEFVHENDDQMRSRLNIGYFDRTHLENGFFFCLPTIYKLGLGHFKNVEYCSSSSLLNYVFGYDTRKDGYTRRFFIIKNNAFKSPYHSIVLRKK